MQNILTAIVNHDKGNLLDSFLLSLDVAVETCEKDVLDTARAGADIDIDIDGLPAPILCYAITKGSPTCVEVLINRQSGDLSLVHIHSLIEIIMMLRQLSYAIKTQLKAPKPPKHRIISCLSLCLYGIRLASMN